MHFFVHFHIVFFPYRRLKHIVLVFVSHSIVKPSSTLFKNQSLYFRSLLRWPSKEYYSSNLVSRYESHQFPVVKGFPLPRKSALAYIDIAGKERQDDNGSCSNCREAKEVAKIAENIVDAGSVKAEEIGVITPYTSQRTVIKREMSRRCGDVEVAICDAFQGREKKVIILSLTRSNDSGNVGFVDNDRRLNVSLTRAKYGLVIVGDGRTLQNGIESGLRSLLLHCHEIRGVVSGTCEGNKMISEEDVETTTGKLLRRPPIFVCISA